MEKFNAYTYEVKIRHFYDENLKDTITVTPTDPYHPEIDYKKGNSVIVFPGSYQESQIQDIKKYLDDAQNLINLLKEKNLF